MIPIVYRYIHSYLLNYLLTLYSSVLRYLVYLGTWFASVSVPTFVSWIDGVTWRALVSWPASVTCRALVSWPTSVTWRA